MPAIPGRAEEDCVEVEGIVSEYKGDLQIVVSSIKRADSSEIDSTPIDQPQENFSFTDDETPISISDDLPDFLKNISDEPQKEEPVDLLAGLMQSTGGATSVARQVQQIQPPLPPPMPPDFDPCAGAAVPNAQN